MKKSLLLILFILISTLKLRSQNYTELNTEKITYQGEYHKEEGMRFSFKKDTLLEIKGSSSLDKLKMTKMELFNTSFTSVQLDVAFEIVHTENRYTEMPGDFYITIAFFDEDKNCLFSEQLVTKDGMRLVNGPEGLNELNTEIFENNLFKFTGSREFGIHQAFMYSKTNTAGGIKPIKYFVINVFHLGAG